MPGHILHGVVSDIACSLENNWRLGVKKKKKKIKVLDWVLLRRLLPSFLVKPQGSVTFGVFQIAYFCTTLNILNA